MAALQVAVLVPGLEAAGGVVELHEAHAPLDQPPRQQALPAEDLGRRAGRSRRAAWSPRSRRRQVEGVGRVALHAKGQLERLDPGAQPAVIARLVEVQFVQPAQGVELLALAVPGQRGAFFRLLIGLLQVGHERPLIRRRQETRAVLPRTFDQRARGRWR